MRKQLILSGRRKATGSGIVMGVIALFIVTAICVGGSLLISNQGLAMTYHQKVGFVANQAAKYASSRYVWNGFDLPAASTASVPQDTQLKVNRMLQELGLPPGQTIVNYQTDITTVTVTVGPLDLVGNVDFLPKSITVQETGTAVNSAKVPPALLALNIAPSTNAQDNLSVLIPCFGRNVNAGGFSLASSASPIADAHPHEGAFTFKNHSSLCLRSDSIGTHMQIRQAGQGYGSSILQKAKDFP